MAYGGSWAALDPATGQFDWQVPTPDGYSWAIGAASAANGVVYRPAQRRLKADAVRPYPRAGLAR